MFPKSQWPNYSNDLLLKINKIYKSGKTNYLIGNNGVLFEKKFSDFFNFKFANAVSNASIGLELSLLSFNFNQGDEIIVTPRSYFSSVSCVERVGLKPVFADIDLKTMNICPKSIENKITKNTKAIICVHLYGMPCDMKKIKQLSKKYNLKIIEDCSQAHGSMIRDKYVGTFGDIAVYSFCQDKIISTGGEGGMIATNSKSIYDKIWTLKDIGKNRNKYQKIDKKYNSFPYVHDYIGTNARLTEVQSCIGLYQLNKLKEFIKKRNQNAKTYFNQLNDCKYLILPEFKNEITHSFYRYTVIINCKSLSRSLLMNNLKRKKINCTVGGCPTIYKENYFKKKYKNINLKNAEYLADKTISFLVDHTITKKDIVHTCDVLKKEINNLI